MHRNVDSRPETFASSHAAQVRAVASAFLRIRPWLIGPMLVPITVLLWRENAPHAQRVALPALMALMLAVFIVDAVRASKADLSERAFIVAMLVTGVGLTGVCALSGGLRSPLTPVLLAPTVTLFAAFGQSRVSIYSGVALALALVVLALAAPSQAFPLLPSLVAYVLGAGSIVLTAALLYVSVAGLTRAYEKLGASRDVLQRESLDHAQERMQSLELLSAKLAHELRNPLQSVKGLVELEARAAEGKSARRLEVVLQEVARLEALADRYLRYTSPLPTGSPVSTNVLTLAESSLATVEARALEKGVSLRLEGDPLEGELDSASVHMALCNLLGNAIDASSGGGEVSLHLMATADTIAFAVADRGAGMNPEQLERAGTPFATGKPGGTGLGLAITKQIAEAHGGALAIESQAGVGTTATITLPRKPWPTS